MTIKELYLLPQDGNPDRLEREGYLEPALVTKIWNEHLSGKRDWSFRIWSVVIFQQWLESIS